MTSLWKFFTSLRLTVACLAIGLVLVFLGTWAQVDEGLWNAQTRWFKSFFIWWGPHSVGWKIPVFPGGYLLGIVLLINLLASHVKRFQWGWKKLGIHLTHGGIVLLLLGQLLTDKFSRESVMSLREGETKVYSESTRDTELIFASDSDGAREQVVSIAGAAVARKGEIREPQLPLTIRVLQYQPNGDIRDRTAVAQATGTLTTALATMEAEYAAAEGLPAQAERALEAPGREQIWRAALKAIGENPKGDIVATAKRVAGQPERAAQLGTELKSRFRETMLRRFTMLPQRTARPTEEMQAQARLAQRLLDKQPITPEAYPVLADNAAAKASAVFDLPESMETDKRNIPYAVVELQAEGKRLGTWLISPMLNPVEVTAGGKTFRMAYRFERYYQPFAVSLLKTTHEVYPGTATETNPEGIPKNFQSRVRIDNQEKGERREVDIFMNNPLRYAGLTFFQYTMGQEEAAGGAALGNSSFQVVKNPSWLAPYFGCFIVGFGMLYQFLYHLIGFINKRTTRGQRPTAAEPKPRRAVAPAAAVP